jgi:hypothetical protein
MANIVGENVNSKAYAVMMAASLDSFVKAVSRRDLLLMGALTHVIQNKVAPDPDCAEFHQALVEALNAEYEARQVAQAAEGHKTELTQLELKGLNALRAVADYRWAQLLEAVKGLDDEIKATLEETFRGLAA